MHIKTLRSKRRAGEAPFSSDEFKTAIKHFLPLDDKKTDGGWGGGEGRGGAMPVYPRRWKSCSFRPLTWSRATHVPGREGIRTVRHQALGTRHQALGEVMGLWLITNFYHIDS